MSRGPWVQWSDERKDEVRKLWLDGWSATQIGAALKPTASRNAVIGLIHRNEWHRGQARPVVKRPWQRKPRQPSAVRKRPPAGARVGGGAPASVPPPRRPQAAPAGPLPTTGTRTLLELLPDQCRFPFWGDRFDLATSLYCGRPRESDATPYCVHHRQLCTQPLSNSRIAKKTREVEAA